MNSTLFSEPELSRYHRHFVIPGFGIEGQNRLKAGKVLVVGAGGLGSPVLLYLAAAGIGTIGIVDGDKVEDSNLHRQVLYDTGDVGLPKVDAARKKLLALNPHIEILTFNTFLNRSNALSIIRNFDVVADGTDNFSTRYLVNDACVFASKPNVYASIFQFEGQVSVFNYSADGTERGPNYRDLFPEPPPPDLVPSCSVAGVLGVLPGIIGSLQALEVIKILTGTGQVLSGRLFRFDALTFEGREFVVKRDRSNPLTGDHPSIHELIDYDQFCAAEPREIAIPEISAEEFSEILRHEDIQLIDVREPQEFAAFNIGGKLIPLGSVLEHTHEISRDKRVVVFCRSGSRSKKAITLLHQKSGFNNLYNLTGGLLAYAARIDPSLTACLLS